MPKSDKNGSDNAPVVLNKARGRGFCAFYWLLATATAYWLLSICLLSIVCYCVCCIFSALALALPVPVLAVARAAVLALALLAPVLAVARRQRAGQGCGNRI
jgi:hypothetical protein